MSWQSTIVSSVNLSFKGLYNYKPINTTWVDNVHRMYVASQAAGELLPTLEPNQGGVNFYLQKWTKPTYAYIRRLQNNTQVDYLTLERYLRFLRAYAVEGKIPYEKYDPVGYEKKTKVQKKFDSEKSTVEKLTESVGGTVKSAFGVVPVLILLVGGIFVYNLTKKD